MFYWTSDSSGTFLILDITRSQFYSGYMQIWIVKNHIIIQLVGASVWNKENQDFSPLPGSKIPSARLILQYARMLNVSTVDALDTVNVFDHKTRNEDENNFAYLYVYEWL